MKKFSRPAAAGEKYTSPRIGSVHLKFLFVESLNLQWRQPIYLKLIWAILTKLA
jgi:hypothetical protein